MSAAYHLRYRRTDADEGAAWTTLPGVPDDAERIEVHGLEVGAEYDLEVTYIDEDGVRSEPVRMTHVVAGDQLQAPRVTDLQVTGGCLHWESPVDRRFVHGHRVRYVNGESEQWGEMLPAHPGLWPGPPFPLCGIPTGIVTFGVVAVGVDGSESPAPTFLTVDRGTYDPRGAEVHWESDQAALAWPGVLTSAAVVGGDLGGPADADTLYGPETVVPYGDYADDVAYGTEDGEDAYGPDMASPAPYGPEDGTLDYGDTTYEDLLYQVRLVVPPHLAPDGAILTADVGVLEGRSFVLEFRRSEELYGPVNGFEEYGAEVEADEPTEGYGAADGTVWRPWPGQLPAAGGAIEFRVRVPGGEVQPLLTSLAVATST